MRDELVPLLERTGFASVDGEAGADERTLVHVASRHGDVKLFRGGLQYA